MMQTVLLHITRYAIKSLFVITILTSFSCNGMIVKSLAKWWEDPVDSDPDFVDFVYDFGGEFKQ